jgi:hypothetical protein
MMPTALLITSPALWQQKKNKPRWHEPALFSSVPMARRQWLRRVLVALAVIPAPIQVLVALLRLLTPVAVVAVMMKCSS